jgi:hypothetical protein
LRTDEKHIRAQSRISEKDQTALAFILSAAVGRNQSKNCRYRWKPVIARFSSCLWITFARMWQLLRGNCITLFLIRMGSIRIKNKVGAQSAQ